MQDVRHPDAPGRAAGGRHDPAPRRPGDDRSAPARATDFRTPSRAVGRLARTGLCLVLCAAASVAHAATSAADAAVPTTAFEAAIATALARHPALDGKRAEIEAKDHAISAARAQRLPSLDGRLGRQLGGEGANLSSVRLRQPVWTFGRVGRDIDFARADRDAELADERTLRRELAERTAVAWVRVAGAGRRLAVATDDAATLARLADQVRRRAAGRLASRTDVALAGARLVQTSAAVDRLRAELDLARTELVSLTQVDVAVEGGVPERFVDVAPLAELEAAAARTDPTLLRGERLVTLARADAARERARLRPTVYLEAQRFFGSEVDDGREDSGLNLVVEGSVDGFGVAGLARARALDAGRRAAEAELALSRTELERRLASLHADHAAQGGQIDGFERAIAGLDATLDSYRRQYEAGRKEWLDLLNLYRELSELRLQLEQVRTDRIASGIELNAAAGLLDDFPPIETPR